MQLVEKREAKIRISKMERCSTLTFVHLANISYRTGEDPFAIQKMKTQSLIQKKAIGTLTRNIWKSAWEPTESDKI